MNTRRKITLSLYEDAIEQLEVLATERKRGELVSRLIAEEYQRSVAPVTVTSVAEQLRRLAGELDGV